MAAASAFAAARAGGVISLEMELGLHGATVVDPRSGGTLLHAAAEGGSYQAVELLVREGCPKDSVNRYGQTALHLAVAAQHHDCVSTLLALGCDASRRDRDGRRPVDLAFDDRAFALSDDRRIKQLFLSFEGWTPRRHRHCALATRRAVVWMLKSQRQRQSLTSRVSKHVLIHILEFTSQAWWGRMEWQLV